MLDSKTDLAFLYIFYIISKIGSQQAISSKMRMFLNCVLVKIRCCNNPR